MGDYLTADQILAVDDIQVRDEDVPEWGGQVRMRSLTGEELNAFEASQRLYRDDGSVVLNTDNQRAKLVARSLINDAGERLFTDQQIAALGKKNAAVLERLSTVAAELSGLTPAAGKDSEQDQTGSPGSTSPTN